MYTSHFVKVDDKNQQPTISLSLYSILQTLHAKRKKIYFDLFYGDVIPNNNHDTNSSFVFTSMKQFSKSIY